MSRGCESGRARFLPRVTNALARGGWQIKNLRRRIIRSFPIPLHAVRKRGHDDPPARLPGDVRAVNLGQHARRNFLFHQEVQRRLETAMDRLAVFHAKAPEGARVRQRLPPEPGEIRVVRGHAGRLRGIVNLLRVATGEQREHGAGLRKRPGGAGGKRLERLVLDDVHRRLNGLPDGARSADEVVLQDERRRGSRRPKTGFSIHHDHCVHRNPFIGRCLFKVCYAWRGRIFQTIFERILKPAVKENPAGRVSHAGQGGETGQMDCLLCRRRWFKQMNTTDKLEPRWPMKPLNTAVKRMALIAGFVWIAHGTQPASAQTNGAIYIKAIAGVVEILPHGTTNWYRAADGTQLHTSDRVRARAHSSATLILLTGQGESVVRLKAMSEVEILPDTSADGPGMHLIGGILSFFHRDKPSRIRVISDGGNAGILGTEFVMAVASVNGTEQTTLSVIDGQVYFTNAGVTLALTNGQQAVGEPGQAPQPTPGFIANNILQWCFYYPGVLDANELPLTAAETNELAESLVAYRAGDLLVALAKYPDARQPGSDAERVYHAALVLSVGQVEEAETNLSAMSATGVAEKNQRLAAALRTLIAAVKREPRPSTVSYSPRWSEAKTNQLSSEFLADSYYEQSLGGPKALDNALQLARRAAASSPDFGFARERVAELEFSFGKTDRALADLKTALQLSPRNAQALALQGFLLAAQNKTREAIASFNAALAVDSGLGNAWLGRGLCGIKRGDAKAGREDVLIAAAMEPQRAALGSSLGKAFGDAGDTHRASHELKLAEQLDTNDPTAWLYSALLNEQNNRINEAVRDLEKSQELNNNRSVYRSGLLLDQDRAVRSANLARIYDEAGMDNVALREASRAVSADYENYSAHLFLANSYEQLRASNPFDLRYETPAFSEYLIASLLGPPDGRMLAQPVTQQEYTQLFDRDSFGVSSSTEYLSRGAWDQYAAQYGTFRNSSYALETESQWDPGATPNGSLETKQISLKVKQMLSPSDGLFFQMTEFEQDRGDLAQRFDPRNATLGMHDTEKQEPDILVGLDHKWSESQHTLLLVSRFNDSLQHTNPIGPVYLLADTFGAPTSFFDKDLSQEFSRRLTVDSFELQHLVTFSQFQTIAGFRLQYANDKIANTQTVLPYNSPGYDNFFAVRSPSVVIAQAFDFHSFRASPYLYEYWRVANPLTFIAGASYDYLSPPRNSLFAPLSDAQEVQRGFSPKAALIWTPSRSEEHTS